MDAFLVEKGGHHVAKHRHTMGGFPSQFPPGNPMSHKSPSPIILSRISRRLYSVLAGGIGRPSSLSFIPNDRPISARISLISFRDLRPKFLVFSISASVFCTN